MKNLLIFACILFFASCNDKSTKTEASAATDTTKMASASSDDLVYPYTMDHAYADWQPGDRTHAMNVMKALKAYETGNIAECMSYFADSVDLRFDGFQQKLSRDSLAKIFTEGRNQNKSISVKLDDWESVISKDKSEEWVTLWYKQIWTDNKGKTDSMSVVNDAKIVNGKIAVLDEALRHFQAKK